MITLLFVFLVLAVPAFADVPVVYQEYPAVRVIVNGQEVNGGILMDGRTMVPLRAISELLGLNVQWDATTNTVYISSPAAGAPQKPVPVPAQDVIRIGLIAPLTGDLKTYGQSVKNGFALALEEKKYRAGTFKLEGVIVDDRNNATEAVNGAMKLIKQDRVSAIVGSVTSLITIPLATVAQENGVLLITPTATNPRVTVDNGRRRDCVFRACFVDPLQGTAAATFALDKLKAGTAAVLYDRGNAYSAGLAQKFKEAFEKGGGRVTVYEAYVSSNEDFTPVLKDIARQKPSILYFPDYYFKAGQIGRQGRALGIAATFMGGDGWDSPDIDWQAMKGGYFTTHWSSSDPRPEVREWVNRYKARFGAEPDMFAALAYDATRILLQAIETAASRDPAAIKEAMQNMKEFPAVSGMISGFDLDGNPVKAMAVMQIKDGKAVFVTNVMPGKGE